jgi:hypothetical protein
MLVSHKNYIKENRFKQSMLDMADDLGISYNKVRNYMVENDLQVTKQQVYEIRATKLKNTIGGNKPWHWNALP